MVDSSPDFSGGAMIALYPPPTNLTALTLDGGLDPAELHSTVAYLGDATDTDPNAMLAAAKTVAKRTAIRGQVSGHARFTGGPTDVLVALVDSADLEVLRRDLMDALTAQGITPPADHGYTPHITLTYLDAADTAPLTRIPATPVEFGYLAVVHGTDRTDLPFKTHSLREAARRAFAFGFATSGGPLTERVKAASVTAVNMACEHAGEPGVLEATLQLGSLEGTWARIYGRREVLYTLHDTAVSVAWRKLIAAHIDFPALIATYRRRIGLTETNPAGQAEEERRERERRAIALALALAALRNLFADTHNDAFLAVIAAIEQALWDGTAEGTAGAVGIAAQQLGHTAVDFDAAYTDARASLTDMAGYDSQAQAWLAKMVTAAAHDLAQRLVKDTAAGVGSGDMTDNARDTTLGTSDTHGGPSSAVALLTDWALGHAFTLGALAAYAALRVTTVDWVTAGDGRVCPTCQGHEDKSPYTVVGAPQPPQHPRCRCVLVPASPLTSMGVFARYLMGGR